MTRLLPLLFWAFLLALPEPLNAQTVLDLVENPEGVNDTALTSPEAVQEMVSRLSDAEVRSLLLTQLDSVAAEAQSATANDRTSLFSFVQQSLYGPSESFLIAVERMPRLWVTQSSSFQVFWDRLGVEGIAYSIALMTLAVSAGLAVELIFRRLIKDWVEKKELCEISGEVKVSLNQTLLFLSKRFATDILAVLVFYQAAQNIGPLFIEPLKPLFLTDVDKAQIAHDYIDGLWIWLVILPRVSSAVVRFLNAPNRPEHRLVHANQATAVYMGRYSVIFAFLFGFTNWLASFNVYNGVIIGDSRLGFWLNLILLTYMAVFIWFGRAGLSKMLIGPDTDMTRVELRIGELYPLVLIGITAAMWWISEIIASLQLWHLLEGWPHITTVLLLGFAPAMETMVRGLVRHLVPPMTGDGPLALKAYQSTKRSYIRIGRVLVLVAVLFTIGRIWHLDFSNLAAASLGAQVAGSIIEVLVVIAIGYLFWEVASLWINRKLAAEHTAAGIDMTAEEPGGGEGGGVGGSRLSTILPLLLGVMKVTIVAIFGLIALGNLGIDITPLLAGAGIVGLAVGFGAQKLVSDVVSGIFFLIDDAFRTGEYVEVEGTLGTVEYISIRSMQLRHHKGPVHTIPYGEIPKITNYSRDWVIMKLRFTVPFDTDPNKVKKLFKKIGAEMMEVPEFAEDMLQPFKSQGVFDFDDVGMIIRGKFMAKPGKQFTIRKEIYNRVKKTFEENGIDFACREVRVAIPGLDDHKDLTEEDKATIAAAATQVAQEQVEPETGGEKKA